MSTSGMHRRPFEGRHLIKNYKINLKLEEKLKKEIIFSNW